MSIKPEFVEKIQDGSKVIEIRKKFSKKWRGCRISIYSSSPEQAIVGYSTIDRIDKDSPNNIWDKFESSICCSKKQFDEYVKDSKKIFAIHLKNFEPYRSPLFLSQLSYILKRDIIAPQSYLSLGNSRDWSDAISVAELLHGRFQLYSPAENLIKKKSGL
ncbi:MAG: hypothetical protein GY860_17960 [Desulfobacteraceae bacterium]|nr:hypothetical protein [Desulfobacteraceae bacterium]